MKENLKKFLEEASKNEELKAKLAALTDKDTAAEKAIGIAKEYGYTLTAEDFEPDEDDNLSFDEMGQVAGGSFCIGMGASDGFCLVSVSA
jgi:predicted ribosomally synthesized peptide with nif11-like leader